MQIKTQPEQLNSGFIPKNLNDEIKLSQNFPKEITNIVEMFNNPEQYLETLGKTFDGDKKDDEIHEPGKPVEGDETCKGRFMRY